MGSSITLTLWAFLGMESAAQNSAAVENPKRNVPLACLFGTLGAAVVYVLSTTVIQGIVPNAELANSTGPFGLAFAQMFNPIVGTIVMALAVLACLGSLLGWQFTIASTGKSAAEERMFPAFFAKTNSMGAPITGMIVLGVVQTLFALSTISPTLSEQFSALVNLAVVTNVIPYVVALSALVRHHESANAPEGIYTTQRHHRDDRDGIQRLRALRLGQGRGDGRHARARHHLHHLGVHCSPLRGFAAPQPLHAPGKPDRGARNFRKENSHASSTNRSLARPCRWLVSRAIAAFAVFCAHARGAARIGADARARPGGRPHSSSVTSPMRARFPLAAERAPPKATASRCASGSSIA